MSSPSAKRSYHAPVLRDHGTVAEITLAIGNTTEVLDNAGYGPADTPTS